MTTTVQFLDRLRNLGVVLTADGDRLRLSAPKNTLTPEIREELTRQKAEILRLLAAGRSDPEIAAALFVSPRTVEWHVANLYRKFELHSRAAVAAQAVRLGIA